MVQVAVLVVVHDRGLELQVSCPESTLTTMFPIVMEMESARVLKMEFFSVREEPRVSELLSDLKIELCSTNDEAWVRASLSDLKIEFFSVRPEAGDRLPVRPTG